MNGPLRFRSPDLVRTILTTVYDDDDDPIANWTDLVDAFTTPKTDAKTVDGTLRDLVRYGALERIGHYTRRQDTRGVRPTYLGRQWLHTLDEEDSPTHNPTERPNS